MYNMWTEVACVCDGILIYGGVFLDGKPKFNPVTVRPRYCQMRLQALITHSLLICSKSMETKPNNGA